MRYVEFRHPAALDQARQILAIPSKRHDQPLIRHLTMDEINAILDAPDITTRLGIRDRAMLHLCFAAALRVSELVTAQVADLSLRGTASLRVQGKGRRERCLPLWKQTAADVRTTEVYLRVDPTDKLEAVEAVLPPELRRGRFKAPDALIAMLLDSQ